MSFFSKSLPPVTDAQMGRWARIRARGCLCCIRYRMPAGWPVEIHHLKSGNLRMGHDYTIGLCPWHHRGTPFQRITSLCREIAGPSLADGSAKFHDHFGTDEELLAEQNRLIEWTAAPKRERRRKSRCTPSSKTFQRPAGGFA